jgi:hypothetical protein
MCAVGIVAMLAGCEAQVHFESRPFKARPSPIERGELFVSEYGDTLELVITAWADSVQLFQFGRGHSVVNEQLYDSTGWVGDTVLRGPVAVMRLHQ